MCAPVDNFPSYYLKKNVYDILNGNSVYASDFLKDSLIYEIFIIKDETDLEFYTSDVPCFVVNNKFEASNKNNAIYFPITDKILLRMKRNRQLVDKINFYKAYNSPTAKLRRQEEKKRREIEWKQERDHILTSNSLCGPAPATIPQNTPTPDTQPKKTSNKSQTEEQQEFELNES